MALAAACLTSSASGLVDAREPEPVTAPVFVVPEAARPVVQQLRALRGENPPDEQDVEDQLVAQVDACLELCLHSLANLQVPAAGAGEPQQLSIQQRNIFLAALARMPHERVRTAVDSVMLTVDTDAARAAACRVLGRVGSSDDLDLLLDLATPAEPEADLTRGMRAGFRDGLAQLLTQSRTAFGLQRAWRRMPAALSEPALEAIGDSRDVRCLSLLAERITWDEDEAMLAIAQVRLVGPSLDIEMNEAVAAALASHTDSDDRNLAEAACLALGELRSAYQLELLIERLDAGDEVVRRAARQALVKITGEDLPGIRKVWEIWFERARDEATARVETLDRALSGSSTDPLVHALNEATRSLLERDALAALCAEALKHAQVEVRRTACTTLAALDSPAGVGGLIGALNDEDDDVRDLALTALRSITKREDLETADEWRALVDEFTGLY